MDLKFDQDKPKVNLVEPNFILGIAGVLTFGAKKYEESSWKTVNRAQDRYYAAAMRHILAYRKGEQFDKETGLSHLHHAATNLMFLAYFQEKGATTNELQPTSGISLGNPKS